MENAAENKSFDLGKWLKTGLYGASPISAGISLAGIVGSLLNNDKGNQTDSLVSNKLRGIINQGGLGFSPAQLTQKNRMIKNELMPEVRRAELGSDVDASRRGIYGSPQHYAGKSLIRTDAATKLGEITRQLLLDNQSMKNNSLLNSLNMLAGYGDIERQNAANNQQLWLSLFEAGLDDLLS